MVNIKPTIEIYDNEGNLSKTYNKAINKMIDQTFDIDLEQFDFDEVAKGKCKEFDDLVTKLCAKSGLGSDDIYSMLLERFIGEYDMDYDVNYVYGLDELEESKKSSCAKEMKESRDNSQVKYDDIFACDVRYDVFVEVYDKDKYKQLADEDLLLWTKSEKDVNLNWKMFQDEISYLRDDMNNSDDFSMKLQLSNGTLHIYTIYDGDDSIVMEIYIAPKIVTD